MSNKEKNMIRKLETSGEQLTPDLGQGKNILLVSKQGKVQMRVKGASCWVLTFYISLQ